MLSVNHLTVRAPLGGAKNHLTRIEGPEQPFLDVKIHSRVLSLAWWAKLGVDPGWILSNCNNAGLRLYQSLTPALDLWHPMCWRMRGSGDRGAVSTLSSIGGRQPWWCLHLHSTRKHGTESNAQQRHNNTFYHLQWALFIMHHNRSITILQLLS